MLFQKTYTIITMFKLDVDDVLISIKLPTHNFVQPLQYKGTGVHISKSFVGFNNPESNCIKFYEVTSIINITQHHFVRMSVVQRLTKYFCQE